MSNGIDQAIVGSRRGFGRQHCCNYTSIDNNSSTFASDVVRIMMCTHINRGNKGMYGRRGD